MPIEFNPHSSEERLQSLDNIKKEIVNLQNSDKINSRCYQVALDTIRSLKSYLNVDERAFEGKTEEEVLNKLNSETKGGGIEAKFVTGNSIEQKKASLESKVDTFIQAFNLSKDEGSPAPFLKALAQGDGCMTARIGRIEEFLAAKELDFDFESAATNEEIYAAGGDLIGLAFMNEIDDEVPLSSQEFEKNPDFAKRLENRLASLASNENQKMKKIHYFLVNEGIISKNDDWNTVAEKLIKEQNFLDIVLKRAENVYRFE